MGRWMARFASRLLMLLGRLAVFSLASKRRRLAGRLPFQLLDPLLQWLDEFAELLILGTKSGVLGFKLLDALVTPVGFHAILPSSPVPVLTFKVCAMKADRANTETL